MSTGPLAEQLLSILQLWLAIGAEIPVACVPSEIFTALRRLLGLSIYARVPPWGSRVQPEATVSHSIASCCLEDKRQALILAKGYQLGRNLVGMERIENQRLGP